MLDGKRVLVTGGSRGIGAGIVRMLMKEGAEVAFIFRRGTDAADALCEEMASRHPQQRCVPLQCDVNNAEGMRATINTATAELGRIDALVNNAGITSDATFVRMTRSQWDEVLSTNLGGMFNATQPVTLQFVRQRSGSIVNLTSVSGIYGSSGQANYSASKAGIIGLTRALAKEFAPYGVRVNAVAPGFIETEMITQMPQERLPQLKLRIPVGRFGTVDDVAHLVCFLISDRSTYITGEVIQVGGGITL